ncbi:snare-like protein [Wolfiporia cocos MD-104 SS10]|uniref:Snare-like protein n=1 Tax=Wolfiporia cocos (strain MD-104) TaxID=742152 RepID=A0A2H3JIB2_WOLCO|nr:snare-like protein [Wolfiporia cocos MD-104 SS10]
MKIYGLTILHTPLSQPSMPLVTMMDLSSFSFYQHPSISEFMSFFGRMLAERTPQGGRESVQEGSYTAHVYNWGGTEQVVGVLIADHKYPVCPAFLLLTKALDDFMAKVLTSSYAMPSAISFPEVQTYVQKYQDPCQADAIMHVQQELNKMKIVLHKTTESVLEHGERINDLVDRLNVLSTQTKVFYRTTKEQNSCCVLM